MLAMLVHLREGDTRRSRALTGPAQQRRLDSSWPWGVSLLWADQAFLLNERWERHHKREIIIAW
jgi:hypothetical protein